MRNKHPTASKSSQQYDVPRGQLRPDEWEGRVMRAAAYELGCDDYSSESRDYKGVPVTFRAPSGEIIHP